MRFCNAAILALHFLVSAVLFAWAPTSSAAAVEQAVVLSGAGATVSPSAFTDAEGLGATRDPAPDRSTDAPAAGVAWTDLPAEVPEAFALAERSIPKPAAHAAPADGIPSMWTSATSDGLLRPPKLLTAV